MSKSKRKYPERPCEECGTTMKVAAKNQRFCFLCRLAHAALLHRGKAVPCPACDQPFIDWLDPLRRKKGGNVCGKCLIRMYPMGGRESVPGACGWLAKGSCLYPPDRSMYVYSGTVRLCYPCLTDPKKFAENRKAILARHRGLTASDDRGTVGVGQNGPTGPEQETE